MKGVMRALPTVGSLLIIASLLAFTGVVQAKDKDKKGLKRAEPETMTLDLQQVSVLEETFSLPIDDAAKLLRKIASDADRYNELVRLVDAKRVRLERLVVLRTISGQQSKVESVNEVTFADESNPAHGSSESGKRARAAVTLHIRNVGDTLNFTPQIGNDGRLVNLTLISEKSRLTGYSKGSSQEKSQLPIIGTSRVTTSVMLNDGVPFLLGTFTPPVDDGIAPRQKENRIWLEFITVQLPRVTTTVTLKKEDIEAGAHGASGSPARK